MYCALTPSPDFLTVPKVVNHVPRSAPLRIRRVGIAATAVTCAVGGIVAIVSTSMTAEAAMFGYGTFDVPAGYGATVPFTEYEAEKAATNGTVVGPDLTHGSIGSESSGRSAVRLGPGQYVEFTLSRPANAVDISASVNRGGTATLSASVNGAKADARFNVHSKYTHIETYIAGSPKPYHLYSDYRIRLGQSAPTGAKVRIAAENGTATIDLAQFEQVGDALARPGNSLSVTDLGADPSGSRDSTDAFQRAINEAGGRVVWVPTGRYQTRSLSVARGVTIKGAGPWHTEITQIEPARALFNGEGQTGTFRVSDLAAFGQVSQRSDNEASNFFHGVLGRNGTVSNVWVQNFKVGLWLMGAGNDTITIENSRFLALLADGVNFNGHVQNGTVRNNYFRNQGDDSLAVWSVHSPVRNTRFLNNTLVLPNVANGIAVYGGIDTTISKNVIVDTLGLGSGIALSNQTFGIPDFQPLAGTVSISDNQLIRTGMMNPNWNHPMGAVRIDANDLPVGEGVRIELRNNAFLENPYSVFQFVSGNGKGLPITNVTIDGATVDGVGTVVLQAETGGSATISNVTAKRVAHPGAYNCAHPGSRAGAFAVSSAAGNMGWSTSLHAGGCTFPGRKDMGPADPPQTNPATEQPTADPTEAPPTTVPPARPTTAPPTTVAPTRPTTAPPAGDAWAAWTPYTIGQVVTYNGVRYTCRQAHTAVPGWEPPNVLSLWLPA
jgi:hypothetical protein